MKVRRSQTIVPASVPEYIEKSVRLECDVVVLDLQDAVVKQDKAKLEGRRVVVDALRKGRGAYKCRELCVRVNSPGSPWFIDDLKAVIEAGVDSIRLTHAYGLADVMYAERCIMAFANGREVDIHLSLDMPSCLFELEDIARRSELITSVWLSSGDFGLETGSSSHGPNPYPNDEWLTYTRGKIVNVARSHGWNAGDIIRPLPTDPEQLRNALRRSRSFGFDGCAIVIPRLIHIVNEEFGVTAAELAWAKDLATKWDVLAAGAESNRDFHTIDGKNVMRPGYEYALRVIHYDAVLRGDPEAVASYSKFGLATGEYLAERRAAPIMSTGNNGDGQ